NISTRGTWIETNLFCLAIPSSGPTPIPPPPVDPTATRRQAHDARVAPAGCKSCHNIIDPGGYSLEHFDAMGNYGDVDNGKPVDSSGAFTSPMLSFNSFDDLAPQLAESCPVAQCFAKMWMSDAFDVPATSANLPFTEGEINHAANAFANSD